MQLLAYRTSRRHCPEIPGLGPSNPGIGKNVRDPGIRDPGIAIPSYETLNARAESDMKTVKTIRKERFIGVHIDTQTPGRD